MNDIVKTSGAALAPTTMDEAFRFSQAVHQSGLAPYALETPQAIMVAMVQGMELGMSPMQSIQSIAVINGRPCLWGDALIGVVRSHPKCKYVREWIEGEGDAMTAWCETHRQGEPDPVKMSFSVDDAKRAGLWSPDPRVTRRNRKTGSTYETDNDSPWFRYPKRMLQMRARSWCLRDVYADVLKGIQVREEVMDQHRGEDHAKDITPARPAMVDRLANRESGLLASEGFNRGDVHQSIDDAIAGEPVTAETVIEAEAEDMFPGDTPMHAAENNGGIGHLVGAHRDLVREYASAIYACTDNTSRIEVRDRMMPDFLDANEDARSAQAKVDGFIRRLAGEDRADKLAAFDELLAFTGMSEEQLKGVA